MTDTQEPDAVFRMINLAAIIRQCRLTICEAYFTGGHSAALAALAAASVRLFRLVRENSLRAEIAHEQLWEVADNLTLTKVCGEAAVAIALDTGPRLYETLETPRVPPSPEADKVNEAFVGKTATGGHLDRILSSHPPKHVRAPQSLIEAIIYAVRDRGLAALQEPATKERLSSCDQEARSEINKRIDTLIASGRVRGVQNAA
jgi:hypothetical protein